MNITVFPDAVVAPYKMVQILPCENFQSQTKSDMSGMFL